MRWTRTLPLGLVLVIAGCATTSDADRPDRERRDANRITPEEIAESHYTDAFQLIRALRPRWLDRRGPISFADPTAGEVVVYMDGTRIGGIENLQWIPIRNVGEVEYLDELAASSRYGLGHQGGAILVTSRLPER